jgi:hypothetical protein
MLFLETFSEALKRLRLILSPMFPRGDFVILIVMDYEYASIVDILCYSV